MADSKHVESRIAALQEMRSAMKRSSPLDYIQRQVGFGAAVRLAQALFREHRMAELEMALDNDEYRDHLYATIAEGYVLVSDADDVETQTLQVAASTLDYYVAESRRTGIPSYLLMEMALNASAAGSVVPMRQDGPVSSSERL